MTEDVDAQETLKITSPYKKKPHIKSLFEGLLRTLRGNPREILNAVVELDENDRPPVLEQKGINDKASNYHNELNKDLENDDSQNYPIKKTIIIPPGLDLLDGRNVGQAGKIYIDRVKRRVYRPVDPERYQTDKEFLRKDFEWKIEVARRDKTGLTPKIYAYDPDNLIIEMELIEGQSFDQISSIPPKSALDFIKKLKEFHDLGLYHGDLFPLNHYFLTPTGEIRLIDPIYIPYDDPNSGITLKKIQETDLATAMNRLREFGYTESILQMINDIEQTEIEEKHTESMPVEEVIYKYDVAFVHSFSDKNAFLRGDWEIKLKNLLVAKRISLACSTIKAGDTYKNMLSPFGVLINSGNVSFASPEDSASKEGKSSEERVASLDFLRQLPIEFQTRWAILNRASTNFYKHNEIHVIEPKIFGIYVCVDRIAPDESDPNKKEPPIEEIREVSLRLEIPVYIIENGQIYESFYDEENNVFKKRGDPILPKKLTERDFKLDQSKREQIIDEFRRDFPFKEPWKHPEETYPVILNNLFNLRRLIITNNFVDIDFLKSILNKQKITINEAFQVYCMLETANSDLLENARKKAEDSGFTFKDYQQFIRQHLENDRVVFSREELDEYLTSGIIQSLEKFKD